MFGALEEILEILRRAWLLQGKLPSSKEDIKIKSKGVVITNSYGYVGKNRK